MIKTYDVAVIGSGLIGVATAYEMAKRGQKTVLLDAGGLGAGASGANTGLLLFEGATKGRAFDICAESIRAYEDMGAELGEDIGFSVLPMINYFTTGDEFPKAKALMDFYVENGFRYEMVSDADIHKMEPDLCMDGILGGLFFEQWKMDPLRVIFAYFARAREYGMDWMPRTRVTGFEKENGRVTGVVTPGGTVRAGQFVVAAGAWTRELMLTLGIDLPEFYIQGAAMVAERGGVNLNHAVAHFKPIRPDFERAASRYAMAHGWETINRRDTAEFIVLKDAHDNLLSSQRTMVQTEMVGDVPPDFLRDMSQNVIRHFPALGRCKIVRSWICPVPFTADEKPFFGFVPPYNNVLVSSGYVSVLIMAPVLGRLAAQMLQGEPLPYDLSDFDPLRFEKDGKGERTNG